MKDSAFGVGGMCLGSSPALESSGGVKVFGCGTSYSQTWSNPAVSLHKTFSDSSLRKGSIQMLYPRPLGPISDLPPTFLYTHLHSMPHYFQTPGNCQRARPLPTQCSLPGMLSLPICLAHVLRLALSISPFEKPLLDFIPPRNGSFFFVFSSLLSSNTKTAVRMHHSLTHLLIFTHIHSLIDSLTHSFINQLLGACCLPAAVLDTGDTDVNKTNKNPYP